MTVKCSKCGGYIPDLMFGSGMDRHDCKNHIKPEINFYIEEYRRFRSD